ncbi:LysR substrate-binding domain-containing protein [Streptomyces vinaceus]|uniref:LysR substrate-binding domain-containing protein n=1 Tax=Streptomyces vinaceus TaxID=1960 RepID=UPI003810904D
MPGDTALTLSGASSTASASTKKARAPLVVAMTTRSGAGRQAATHLADRSWVHYAPGNGLAEVVDQVCAAAGFRPRAAVRTEQTAAATLLAAAGLGTALDE